MSAQKAGAKALGIGLLLAPAVILITALATGVAGQSEDPAKLYSHKRFFELRSLLESETANTPAILFYRGMVANAFNQPAASADFLTALLRAAGKDLPDTTITEVLGALDDDYSRLFQYAKAADVRDKLLPFLQKDLPPQELSSFKSVTAFWRWMASTSPQTVEIPGDTVIDMTEGGEVPVEINGLKVPLLPDTGSALCMIVRPEAERLGLEVLDINVEVGTATGKAIKAKPCLVPELSLAGITVRNAVFLVVPEEMLYFPDIRRQLKGLMGFPILNGLTELAFTRTRRLIVTSPPKLEGPPNVFLVRTDPIVEVQYQGQSLQFFLDTGAFQTELYPRFFKAFEPEILKHGIYVPATVEGVGTHAKAPVYLVSDLTFRVAGKDVRFSHTVPVLTRPTGPMSDVLDGTFSLDILAGHEELALNYAAMRMSLR